MYDESRTYDAETLRERLMAPEPMQRATALHALEVELEHCSPEVRSRLASEVERFAARGMPYYQRQDRHFQAWVSRAVAYWEELHSANAGLPNAP